MPKFTLNDFQKVTLAKFHIDEIKPYLECDLRYFIIGIEPVRSSNGQIRVYEDGEIRFKLDITYSCQDEKKIHSIHGGVIKPYTKIVWQEPDSNSDVVSEYITGFFVGKNDEAHLFELHMSPQQYTNFELLQEQDYY